MRATTFTFALLLAGCGSPNGTDVSGAEMTGRTWQYYVANRDEIEPMQQICREWAGSNAPSGAQPAVITTNCRAAAFAKSQLAITPKD